MAFCSNCGATLENGARFCSGCGKPVSYYSNYNDQVNNPLQYNINSQPQHVIDGSVHICPVCGVSLNSFQINCPYCGHEFRDTSSSSAIRDFQIRLEQIESQRMPMSTMNNVANWFGVGGTNKTDEQIINLIRNFGVPNTKEDVTEFMILASSNIDLSILSKYGNTAEMSASELKVKKMISEAWIAKMEQVYQKALVSFGNTPDFVYIKEIYTSKKKDVASAKRQAMMKPILMWGAFALFGLVIEGGTYGLLKYSVNQEVKLESELNAIVKEIQIDIRNKDYDEALIKANSLYFDESLDQNKAKKWDTRREEIIKKIEEAEEKNK